MFIHSTCEAPYTRNFTTVVEYDSVGKINCICYKRDVSQKQYTTSKKIAAKDYTFCGST
jgi:hypothetical protein